MTPDCKKHFRRLKTLAIVALCCTVVLWTFLWAAAATPSGQSRTTTGNVLTKLNKLFGLSKKLDGNVPTQNIKLNWPKEKLFNELSLPLQVDFTPKKATDRELLFSSDNEKIIKVSEDGVITGVSRGSARITAKLKSNPSLSTTISINCYGDNPVTTPISISTQKDVKVGETSLLVLNNGTASPNGPHKITSSDTSVLNYYNDRVAGVSPGTATLTLYYADSDTTLTADITVAENPSFVKPTALIVDSEYVITHGEYISFNSIVRSAIPSSAPKDVEIRYHGEQVALHDAALRGNDPGRTTLTIVSRYDETVTATTDIVVKPMMPSKIEIVGSSNRFSPNESYRFWAKHDTRDYFEYSKWEVVSGRGEINKNGYFMTKYYGKTVIRCTSTIDPSLVAEFEVDAELFSDAYSFTRKLIGHFGLSTLLGFGIFGTTFLLFKRKWLCAVFTPILSITYAGVSELIQKYTPGRFCTLSDIFIDTLGALSGAIVGAVLVGIVCLLWRIINRVSFDEMASAYKHLNFKTAFKKKN